MSNNNVEKVMKKSLSVSYHFFDENEKNILQI